MLVFFRRIRRRPRRDRRGLDPSSSDNVSLISVSLRIFLQLVLPTRKSLNSPTLPEFWTHAEMGEDAHRRCAAAVVHWRGARVVDGDSKQRFGGYDVGAVARWRGMLGGDLSVAAQANVDLRPRPRIDPRGVGVAFRRAGAAAQGHIQRRPRDDHQDELPHCAGSVLFPAIRGAGGRDVYDRALDLGLASSSSAVPSAFGSGLRLSRDVDDPYFEDSAIGYYAAGLSVFGSSDLPWQHQRVAAWDTVTGVESRRVDGYGLVAGVHWGGFPPYWAIDLSARCE